MLTCGAAFQRAQVCNGLAGETSLASMPQLAAVFDESYEALDEMEAFTAGVEAQLNGCLRTGSIPGAELVDAIAVAKIKCVEVALARTEALRKEVGCYALMHMRIRRASSCCETCSTVPLRIRIRRWAATP